MPLPGFRRESRQVAGVPGSGVAAGVAGGITDTTDPRPNHIVMARFDEEWLSRSHANTQRRGTS